MRQGYTDFDSALSKVTRKNIKAGVDSFDACFFLRLPLLCSPTPFNLIKPSFGDTISVATPAGNQFQAQLFSLHLPLST